MKALCCFVILNIELADALFDMKNYICVVFPIPKKAPAKWREKIRGFG